MAQRRTAAVILALSLVLAACGGSSGPAAPEAAAQPTTLPASPVAPPAPEDASAPSVDAVNLVEHLRRKTMDLWDVYNTHDPDALRVFYHETYWGEQEESIRSNMQPFKLFGVSITAEETSPPTEIEPGKWETRHTASFPLGSIYMVFIYEEFDGEWLLTYAEDQ